MSLEDLFDECAADEKYKEPDNNVYKIVDKLVVDIEASFTGLETDTLDREKEKKEISEKLKKLEHKLSNIKNPPHLSNMPIKRREKISKKLKDQRELIRKKIKVYKVRLDEISIEESPNPKGEEDNKSFSTPQNKWNNNPYDL